VHRDAENPMTGTNTTCDQKPGFSLFSGVLLSLLILACLIGPVRQALADALGTKGMCVGLVQERIPSFDREFVDSDRTSHMIDGPARWNLRSTLIRTDRLTLLSSRHRARRYWPNIRRVEPDSGEVPSARQSNGNCADLNEQA
jgi:hypothetical protein